MYNGDVFILKVVSMGNIQISIVANVPYNLSYDDTLWTFHMLN